MQFSIFLADSLLNILTTEVDETTKTLFCIAIDCVVLSGVSNK